MSILNHQIGYIAVNQLEHLKGFLSDLHALPNQVINILGTDFTVYKTYPITIQYFYKTKLFKVSVNEAAENRQNEIDKFFKSIGFESKHEFLLRYSYRFKVNDLSASLEFNLVSFFKVHTFHVRFISGTEMDVC
jgi:hypothetical protein